MSERKAVFGLEKEQEINGDFEYALQQLITDLVEGDRNKADMLHRWDRARGNDWFIATKKRPFPRREAGEYD